VLESGLLSNRSETMPKQPTSDRDKRRHNVPLLLSNEEFDFINAEAKRQDIGRCSVIRSLIVKEIKTLHKKISRAQRNISKAATIY
jgi:hypothetical protein